MDMALNQVNEDILAKAVSRCRERNIIIPTLAEMKDPTSISPGIMERLPKVGMEDIDPLNLFRITWKNDPKSGLFNRGNWLEFPPELTGVESRIVGLEGRWFPTGSHKVGAAFGCLVPRLVTGQFDPTHQKAVWPSTGNYCRGGAFDSQLLACDSVAILPEEMSRERFAWLQNVATEVIATPGCESNVKEIFDKCWEIRRSRPEYVIFNQFDEFGNAIWHYHVTGSIIEEVFGQISDSDERLAAFVAATGSAGTLAAGDYLRTVHPHLIVAACEALQCPTLLRCGFGGHRIEGIGDKHIPWIHNVRNTNIVLAVDDAQALALLRLFNEPEGWTTLERAGVDPTLAEQLPALGISSICNLVAAIKVARYYDLDRRDVIFIPLTDSAGLYQSRLREMRSSLGQYDREKACSDRARYLQGIQPDYLKELGYQDRKTLHNFKYFTWIEQQGKSVTELRKLWDPDHWAEIFNVAEFWDERIREFNSRVGLR